MFSYYKFFYYSHETRRECFYTVCPHGGVLIEHWIPSIQHGGYEKIYLEKRDICIFGISNTSQDNSSEHFETEYPYFLKFSLFYRVLNEPRMASVKLVVSEEKKVEKSGTNLKKLFVDNDFLLSPFS